MRLCQYLYGYVYLLRLGLQPVEGKRNNIIKTNVIPSGNIFIPISMSSSVVPSNLYTSIGI